MKPEIKNLELHINNDVEQRMQHLQPVSIKLIISHLCTRLVKAFSVLTDLSAVRSFPHSLCPK